MRGFDVLDPQLDLKKNYFLEASAGTGKTFTIENLVVRLVQEGMSVDKILVVTFTRAATLELKLRIRKRLEENGMRNALATWDEAKIFTIHGFCFHTLKEHAFETDFPLTQTEESANQESQKRILKDFLRTGLPAEEIHPRQLEKALKKGRCGMDGLLQALAQPAATVGRSYQAIQKEVEEVLERCNSKPGAQKLDGLKLIELAPAFKGFCDRQGNVHPEYREGFFRAARILQGNIEDLIDLPLVKMIPANLKQKHSYPEPLEELHESLIPLLTEASDVHLILGRLARRASHFLKKICSRDDLFFYDDLILKMQHSIHNPSFSAAVRSEYDAVLIDEFQDTDPVQWEIFSTLFLNHLPLYLVGDPKQSIYRFRGADLYTYSQAKEALGEKAYATLTRNFRSQPSLVSALNTLFQRAGDLIHLPKTGQLISILPITAALPQTAEGKVVFCISEDEEALFGFMTAEIERLKQKEGIAYRECAVLVKDRYQAQRFCALFGLPFATKKNESLLETAAFSVLEDLLLAAFNPRERPLVIKALGGPLFGYSMQQLGEAVESGVEPLYRYHGILISAGILSFFQTVVEELTFPNQDLYLDMWQLVEIIAENTTSVEEYLPYLQKLKLEDPEAEILKARVKCTEDAVQVMTLHVSKGLEFEAVFPIGLMLESKVEEAEELSEKMRQLYVAFTRAKRYLYIPVTHKEKSPIHFFLHKVLKEESLDTFVTSNPHFSLVTCNDSPRTHPIPAPTSAFRTPAKTYSFSFPSCRVHSYSSLTVHAQASESHVTIPSGQMPAGPQIGLILHKVFENLDFSKRGAQLRAYLEHILKGSILASYLETVEQMVYNTLQAQLPSPTGSFCLADVNAHTMIREMEFLYPSTTPDGYLKGFIDLFFEHQGNYYCLDWKSNFLVDYTAKSLEEALAQHSYAVQASIYQSAVHKYLKLFDEECKFAGSFYLFLRGLQAYTDAGIHFFKKDLRYEG